MALNVPRAGMKVRSGQVFNWTVLNMQSGEDLSNQVDKNGGRSAFWMAFFGKSSNLKYLRIKHTYGNYGVKRTQK